MYIDYGLIFTKLYMPCQEIFCFCNIGPFIYLFFVYRHVCFFFFKFHMMKYIFSAYEDAFTLETTQQFTFVFIAYWPILFSLSHKWYRISGALPP